MLKHPLSFACLAALAAGALAFPGLAVPARADDDPKPAEAKKEAKAPAKAELDQRAPTITMQDTEGRSFELQDCGITKKDATAVVLANAKKFGAAKKADLDTKIADLKGVKDDEGELDTSKVKDLAVACGKFFGLTATDDSAEAFKTLGDVANWLTAANNAPILILTWSPRCPSVNRANDKIVEMAAKTNVRIFALASNTRDKAEHIAKYLDSREWNVRIFPDADQRVTDILGGKTTPHFFLFDKDAVLRYRGAIDNDPMGYMDDEDRKDHIVNAITAIRAGKDVAVKETAPSG